MVSIHTSSRGISWELGGADIYKSTISTITTTNNSLHLDYVIIDLPQRRHNDNDNDTKYQKRLPLINKLVNFIKNIKNILYM
jgi:hypothetical protein